MSEATRKAESTPTRTSLEEIKELENRILEIEGHKLIRYEEKAPSRRRATGVDVILDDGSKISVRYSSDIHGDIDHERVNVEVGGLRFGVNTEKFWLHDITIQVQPSIGDNLLDKHKLVLSEGYNEIDSLGQKAILTWMRERIENRRLGEPPIKLNSFIGRETGWDWEMQRNKPYYK